jgi:hypothetical protein
MVTNCGAKKVRMTETSGACATKLDSVTNEPDIFDENIAGYDPEELGASTVLYSSTIAASRYWLPGEATLGRLKVPTVMVTTVLTAMSTPNLNSSSLKPTFLDDIVLTAFAGESTVVSGSGKRSVKSPTTVTISLEKAEIAIAGCKVIVIVTPVSEAMYFDKVT